MRGSENIAKGFPKSGQNAIYAHVTPIRYLFCSNSVLLFIKRAAKVDFAFECNSNDNTASRYLSRDREMQQRWRGKRANGWFVLQRKERQEDRQEGVSGPPHGGNWHFQESRLAALEGRDCCRGAAGGAPRLLMHQPYPHPQRSLIPKTIRTYISRC